MKRKSIIDPRRMGYRRITEIEAEFGISRDTLDRRAAAGELQLFEAIDPEVKRGNRTVIWVLPEDVRRLFGPRPKTVPPPDPAR